MLQNQHTEYPTPPYELIVHLPVKTNNQKRETAGFPKFTNNIYNVIYKLLWRILLFIHSWNHYIQLLLITVTGNQQIDYIIPMNEVTTVKYNTYIMHNTEANNT